MSSYYYAIIEWQLNLTLLGWQTYILFAFITANIVCIGVNWQYNYRCCVLQ